MIEEYKAMRAKSSEARDNQQSILQWSLAASGVVAAGTLTGFAREEPTREFELAVSVALTTVVPLILVAAFAFWLSEVARMLRAARYLREREDSLVRAQKASTAGGSSGTDEVLRMFDNYPLVWENLLMVRGWKGQADLGPFAVTAIYVSLTTLSVSAGTYVASGIERLPWAVERGAYALGATLVLIAVCLAIWGFITSWHERRQPPASSAAHHPPQVPTTSASTGPPSADPRCSHCGPAPDS